MNDKKFLFLVAGLAVLGFFYFRDRESINRKIADIIGRIGSDIYISAGTGSVTPNSRSYEYLARQAFVNSCADYYDPNGSTSQNKECSRLASYLKALGL